MADKKVVIAGATGLVGNAALRHFGRAGGCEVVALSRRKPRELYGARHVSIDLTDPAQCTQAATALQDTTHLVYAALYEAPNLVDGWRDPDQIRTNDLMLRNLMAALEPVAPALRHVALLQGTKAYGVHVRPLNVPAREGRSEMYEQPNFYWAQENFLRELQQGKAWHWSILRPVLIVGEAIGGAMDLIPAARRVRGDAARAGPPARLSRRCRAGVAGGRRRSAGARHRVVGRRPRPRATKRSTSPMATSLPGRMSGRRLRMRLT